ncbi:sugar ABC transporter permease [Litorilinea aerophila]|uniref:carbohydrate ABC transporter permease n=1 Tax=Litorilinea aerophila TaxID=1204385 RepID=UPI001B876E2E|nr:sugar ABC transporter permease [Litorilinea aerophila]MCC9076431.1 sugar ABC transporter permease [Litorilinea aerophila]GIV80576.1 MAG: sugar ABC transporter permease [Litorilinea sp.]
MAKQSAHEGRKWLSAPGILFLVIVTQIPFVLTLYYSLRGWNLLRPDSDVFVGLRNFSRILSNREFYTVLANTVVLTLSVVVITLVLGMILALLLNRPFPGRGLVRTLLISPFLIMPVVTAVLWKNILLDPVFGLSAYVVSLLGLPAIDLIAQYPMQTIILIVSWQWTPFVMLILLAGLQSMPESILEAASLDGAGGLTMFRYMILPHLQRFIEIALLLETIFILNVFGVIFVTTSGGPGIATTNLPYQIFLEAFSRWNVGRASAYGVFAVILANILVLIFLRVIGSQSEQEA